VFKSDLETHVKSLIDSYIESAREFSAMLAKRPPAEVAYDNEVLAGLRKNLAIRKALELAAEKYPDEALQVDDTTIRDITAHYEYLKNHEDILLKLRRLTPKGQ
jgi:hypothetical protein